MMRNLYWKIFISFWLATILIIITTAWVTSQIAQKSSIPVREQVFMNSYANAAVVAFESGRHKALLSWLGKIGLSHHMKMFLISSNGEIIGPNTSPETINHIKDDFIGKKLSDGLFKVDNIIVSHEIATVNGESYRLAAVLSQPIGHLMKIPWAGLTIRLTIAIFISGLICYLLSLYLTEPLRTLRLAAKSLGRGNLHTRVGTLTGHNKDEIAELSHEFDRMAERLESILNSKQRLLQDISHELRSPLARLQVALELARVKTNDKAHDEFDRIEMEAIRLNALIGEILDLSRLNKSTIQLKKEATSIESIVKDIIDDANFEFSHTKPRVLLSKSINTIINIDKKLIHRAIENIVRNSLRYSSEDSDMTIMLKKMPNEVAIIVSDKGPGVPEDQLDIIFNPFHRVDTSREKKTGGYGLGLAIAKQAISLHHGNIVAKNRTPHGLETTISLPI